MNEIRLVYFGDKNVISGSLLLMLNVLEVRPENEMQKGFFIFETKFGQETVRSLSLDLCDPEAKDVLIFRYLSEDEKQSLQTGPLERRYFVLLHGFLNLDYIVREIKTDNLGQFNFLVDMSKNSDFKPFAYVNRHITSKNFYRVVKVKPASKKSQETNRSWYLPLFLLVLAKFLINPINEIKRLAIIAKHSNLRFFARFLELILFIDFVVRVVIVSAFHIMGLHLFYKSKFVAGTLRVISIKSAYFFRHVILMSLFKVFGCAIDFFNLLVRAKDIFVKTLYYRFLHKLYHNVIKKIADFVLYGVLLKLYHNVIKKIADFTLYKWFYPLYFQLLLPFINSLSLSVYLWVRYKIPHHLTMVYYRVYGLLYDAGTATYRFTKLILLYPFFKVYWFCKFQYEKRLKRFIV